MFERGKYYCRGCKKKNLNNPTKLHCSDICKQKDLSRRERKKQREMELGMIKGRSPGVSLRVDVQNKKLSRKRMRKKIKELQAEIRNLRNQKPSSQQAQGFYDTRAWRELRYKAIRRYGRRCMACGTQSGIIQVDHILPRLTHPHLELEFSNLQILCMDCNLGKSWKDRTDWRTNGTQNNSDQSRSRSSEFSSFSDG